MTSCTTSAWPYCAAQCSMLKPHLELLWVNVSSSIESPPHVQFLSCNTRIEQIHYMNSTCTEKAWYDVGRGIFFPQKLSLHMPLRTVSYFSFAFTRSDYWPALLTSPLQVYQTWLLPCCSSSSDALCETTMV